MNIKIWDQKSISLLLNHAGNGVLLLSVLLVLGSALTVVYTKYLNRNLHIQLQQLQEFRDQLHVEWTQLLLEQGTLGADVRVEKIAQKQLGMIFPTQNEITVIKP